MRKLVPSRSWRFILGVSAVLIGLGSLAFSQLVDDSSAESPPSVSNGELPKIPGAVASPSPASETAPSAQVNLLRDDFATTRRALARAKQTQSESGRRARAELDRLRKDLQRLKDDVRLAQRTLADDNPKQAAELGSLQSQFDQALAELMVREQNMAREQNAANAKLNALEEELTASEGIFNDSTAAASPEEALPTIALLRQSLKNTHEEIVASLNDSSRREKDALAVADGLKPTLQGAEKQLVAARETAKASGRGKELEASELRNDLEDSINSVPELQAGLNNADRLQPQIGELDVDAARNPNVRSDSEDKIRELQNEVDASEGLQASLNEDVEKLRSELKQAFRQIISMQMKLEESNKLVNDLERQRQVLLQSKNEGVSGIEGMNRMVTRLEEELNSANAELNQARDSLNAEKVKSAAVINSLSLNLQESKAELERVKALANTEGRDAVSMLELEEELNRTKSQLLALQRQNLEKGSGSAELKAELKNAFGEIMRLRTELSGKDELEQQLANLENIMATSGKPGEAAASPEYVNELIRNLNATKVALQNARAEHEKVRGSLSQEVAALEDKLQQSRQEIDLAQVDMARKELEFSDLVKGLEQELQVTQKALRQAADAHTEGADVIKIMDSDLGAAQNRMQSITDDMQKNRMEAARHIRDLQIELEAARRRHENTLKEIRDKDEDLVMKEAELTEAKARSASLEGQLREVEAMSRTLTELNNVLRSTDSVQESNLDQANALTVQLRDELEQAKIEAMLATKSKEDVERRAGTRILALEKQLRETQDQLELTKGQSHEVTREGAELIAELKGRLNQADAEIARLKQAGAGETVGTQQLAGQLQEALGTIQVLQHNLTEAEKVNAEVDDLRLRLASSLEAKIADKELQDADADVLRKKAKTLEMELAMARQAHTTDSVNARQLFSKFKEELEASRAKVAALESRLGQTDSSSVATIADLEEQLANSNAEKLEAERRMHELLQGKSETVAALEQQLVLTKSKIDELEQSGQVDDAAQARIVELEQQLSTTKSQLDDLQELRKADGLGDDRALALEQQLADTQKRLNELLAKAQENPTGTPSDGVIDELQKQLEETRGVVSKLQSALAERDKEVASLDAELEKVLENMLENQMAGDTGALRQELESLKAQLAEAKANAPGTSPKASDPALTALQEEIEQLKSELSQARQNQPEDQGAALAALQEEIEQLKSELSQARQNQPEDQRAALAALQEEIEQLKSELSQARQNQPEDQGAALAAMQEEIEQLKVELSRARQNPVDPGNVNEDQLIADLNDKTEEVIELQTELAAAKKQLQDIKDLEQARVAGDDQTVAELKARLQDATDAIRKLQQEASQSAVLKEDAQKLDEALEKSFKSIEALKDEIAGLEELNSKLTVANQTLRQNPQADTRLESERDELLRANLALRSDLEKYKNQLRRLQESVASPRPSSGNAANLQAQVTALQSQLEMSKTSEATAVADLDKNSLALKDSMRKIQILETTLAQAEGRIKQLESSGPSSPPAFGTPTTSSENLTTKALRDEILNLRAQLDTANARSGSQTQTESRLRDTSQKLLQAESDLARANQRVSLLEEQAKNVQARRRSDVEREKAAGQTITLLNERLKREEAKTLALQEGLGKARELISSLRGEPGGSFSRSTTEPRRSTMFEESPRRTTFRPSASTRPRPRFDEPSSRTPTTRVQPRPLPERRSSSPDDDWRNRTRSAPPDLPESFTNRTPAGRIVSRGTAQMDFQAMVQFLDKQVRPVANVEFFVMERGVGIDQIAQRARISIPRGQSAAELWVRSIHRGYNYPGVASQFRDALSKAAIDRFKTNSRGQARLQNLPEGDYVIIGAVPPPMGAVGVVWSYPVQVTDGGSLSVNLRHAKFAK